MVRPKYLLFVILLGIAILGLVGVKLFEYTSSLSHNKISDSDVAALGCFIVMVFGFFLCALTGVWILISAALALVRRFEKKQ